MGERHKKGPRPCVRGEPGNPYGVGVWCGEGENKVRGTSTYCSACGRPTGTLTVVFPEDPAELEALLEAWREEDRGTPLEWIWHDAASGEETHP